MRSYIIMQAITQIMWKSPLFLKKPCDLGKEPKNYMKTRINIFLNKDDRKKADEIKVKYQLSLTTIVDLLVQITTIALLTEENGQEKIKHLKTEYLHSKGAKTSIKIPRTFKTDSEWNKDAKLSVYTTNVLKIYLYKEANKYLTKDHAEKYYNECNKRMTQTQDNWWNYNQHLRYHFC